MKLIKVASLFFSLTVTGAVAQSELDYNVPKNEWGDPDLSGVWNFASNTPMQRPEKWGEQEFLTPEQLQEEIVGISKDGPEDRGLSERCIVGFNSGPPFVPSLYNNNVQLFQNENNVVILTEMIHDARIVPVGPKPMLDNDIRLWSGDSRGYWDNDTLVVETKNFNGGRQTFSSTGNNYDMVLTEKFKRTSYDQVVYEFTIDDPATFTDKISAVVPMTKTSGQLYEYACHEGNYGMLNTLRGARVAEENGWDLEGR